MMKMKRMRNKPGVIGFTLIELMIVITVLLILMSIAIPIYERSIIHSKETVLRQDLDTLRRAIEQYTVDKRKAPESLQDLVAAGYLKVLPKDPFTNATDTWTTQTIDASEVTVTEGEAPQLNGISDVHSGANMTAIDGTSYTEW
jgi:general secretion pathway protein G